MPSFYVLTFGIVFLQLPSSGLRQSMGLRHDDAILEKDKDYRQLLLGSDMSSFAFRTSDLLDAGIGRIHSPDITPLKLDTDALAQRLERWLESQQSQPYALLDPSTGGRPKDNATATPLGGGSFGVAFLAWNIDDGGPVVLKVAKAEGGNKLKAECDNVIALHKAIEAGAKDHRHLMRCFRQYMEADPPFIVLEMAGEKSGWEAIVSAQTPESAHGYLKQVIFGLAALDAAVPPMIHHDLKWANVAVNEKKCLKLVDLDTAIPGTVAMYNDKRIVFATHMYTPPEQGLFAHAAVSNPEGLKEYLAAKDTQQQESLVKHLWDKPELWHNFQCTAQAEPPTDGNASCPLSHSWDVYSAGIMAVAAVCGGSELGLAAEKLHRGSDNIEDDVKFVMDQNKWSREVAKMSLGTLYWLQMAQRNTLGYFDFLDVPEVLPEGWEEMVGAKGVSKIKYCQDGKVDKELLRRMVDTDPAMRPTPKQLLEADLFRSVKSQCASDPLQSGTHSRGRTYVSFFVLCSMVTWLVSF